jgi:hypothetical protein
MNQFGIPNKYLAKQICGSNLSSTDSVLAAARSTGSRASSLSGAFTALGQYPIKCCVPGEEPGSRAGAGAGRSGLIGEALNCHEAPGTQREPGPCLASTGEVLGAAIPQKLPGYRPLRAKKSLDR